MYQCSKMFTTGAILVGQEVQLSRLLYALADVAIEIILRRLWKSNRHSGKFIIFRTG